MKIGILTFHDSDENYGQHLQCFALQEYLRGLGHEPYLIRYDYIHDKVNRPVYRAWYKAFNPVLLARFVKRRVLKLGKAANADPAAGKVGGGPEVGKAAGASSGQASAGQTAGRRFSEFFDRYIKISDRFYRSLPELQENPPEADAYIVGSDQVWNFYNPDVEYKKHIIGAFFLDFGAEETRRISYAASFGRRYVSPQEKEKIEPLLRRFDAVSVREKTGIGVCRQCGREDADWVCDPVLLLAPEIYRRICRENEIRRPAGKYVLFYYLENGGVFERSAVFDWAGERGLEVLYIASDRDGSSYEKMPATIPEWLYYVDHAEYVVTNSFHCCLFSAIFGTRFAAVRLNGKNEEMNERLDSLFEMCGIRPRYLENGDFGILEREVEAVDVAPEYREWLEGKLYCS